MILIQFLLQGSERFSLDAETNDVTRRQLNKPMVPCGRVLQLALCAGKRVLGLSKGAWSAKRPWRENLL